MTRDLICSRQFITLEYFSVFTLIRVKWHPSALPANSSHDRFASFFRLGEAEYTYEDTFTVDRHGGCRKRVEESASRTRLFHAYFILHGIASRIRFTPRAVPFSKTQGGKRVACILSVVELVSTWNRTKFRIVVVAFFRETNSLRKIISLTIVSWCRQKFPCLFLRILFPSLTLCK